MGSEAAESLDILNDTDRDAYESLRRRPSTRAERYAVGRSLRKKVPRSSLSEWRVGRDDRNPVALVEESHEGRISDLIPVRVARMADSPYGFPRGSAGVMASDVAGLPATGIMPVVCGDAHLGNVGFYASPERDLVLDLNDFDEAHTGSWEWDLRRLVASTWVAGRHNGSTEKQCEEAVLACSRSYREEMRHLANQPLFTRSFERIDITRMAEHAPDSPLTVELERAANRARERTSDRALPRFTTEHHGERQIVEEPPLITRLPSAEAGMLADGLDEYLNTIDAHWRRVLGGLHAGGRGSQSRRRGVRGPARVCGAA